MSRHVAYCFVLLGSLAANAQPLLVPGPKLQAPPTAPPIQQLPSPTGPGGPEPKPLGITPYSIGQPTDEEQLYLEYLNRMRANPTAEGQRLATTSDPNVLSAYGQFMVDLNLMQAEFATNPPVPPLAMNAQLLSAARWHSGDMFTNQYQGHYQTNGSIIMSPGDRIATNGYRASTYGENVFSYAGSVFHGHAAFAVDWGGPSGGMQNPPGHRDNMLYSSFREVGVGVIDGVNGSVGPQLTTQDFGTQVSSSPFLTGVVYFDLNGNGFYDVGEGIGGVIVNTPGSTYFAVTADSGGYAIPISTNGHYTVTFTASSLSNQTTVTISNLQNAKIDYSLTYSPPTITGPNPASLNQSNTYGFTSVSAATGYQWLQAELSAYTLVEGAENGLSNVTVVSTPGYSVISSDFAQSGNYSFNLEHFSGTDQSITLNPNLLVNLNSQLSFAEMLGYAISNEVADAQISIDGGSSWQTVWSKPGNDGNNPVDPAFVDQTISLGAYAGQVLQVRFVYAYSGGLYFSGGSGVGLYLDNIAVSNAEQLNGFITNDIASGNTFNFSPTVATNYLLEVRAQINNRTLPWGPPFQLSVTVSAAPPTIQLAAPTFSGSQIHIDFAVPDYRAGMAFQLLKSTDLQSGWTLDTSATLQTVVTNSSFRFTTSSGAAQSLFFKVKGT
jgi:uncharacterized protein YkwD